MRLHWKLLLLLLAIALLPLVVSTWQWRQGALNVGDNISTWIGDQAEKTVITRLKQVVEFSTRNLRREMELVETALKVQALTVERAIGQNPPHHLGRPFFDSDYDKGFLPSGMVTSERHLKRRDDGQLAPMSVAYSSFVFRLPEGRRPSAVSRDVDRLSAVLPSFKELGRVYGDLFFWQYITLENGLHAAYPGHGGFPKGYDPRTSEWYIEARNSGGLSWGSLTVDASTGQLITTASMPVFGPQGGFAGVTAIDLEIVGLLQNLGRQAHIVSNAEAFLIRLTKDGAKVIAHPSYDAMPRLWAEKVALNSLPEAVAGRFSVTAKELADGETAIIRLPVEGKDTVWALGRLDAFDLYLVLSIPFADISGLAGVAERFIEDETYSQLRLTALMSIVLIAFVAGAAFFGSRTVTEPLRELAAVARKVAKGDLTGTVPVSSKDEIGDLARIFNRMIPRLKERLSLRQSLALAKEVQQHLLPKEPPQIPGLDIAVLSLYCDQTGGDYYDFLPPPDGVGDGVVLVVADITGHGASAALLMASFRAALRARLANLAEPENGLAALNRQVADDTQGGRFVTFLGVYLDMTNREVRWLCAGHEAAIVLNPKKGEFKEWGGEDIPIGIDPDWSFGIHTASLPAEERIIALGTDGIWECRNTDGEMFGQKRFRAVLQNNAGKTAKEICAAVRQALSDHRGERPQDDDITLIVAKTFPGSALHDTHSDQHMNIGEFDT